MSTSDEIDWDISVDDGEDYNNYDITAEESGIVVELPSKETNTVKNDEMYPVLDNPKTRDEFINQLFEVRDISLAFFVRSSWNKSNFGFVSSCNHSSKCGYWKRKKRAADYLS